MAKVTAPSGLGMSRKGNNITFKWKRGDKNYSAQELQYKIHYTKKWGGWKKVAVAKATTSKAVKIDFAKTNVYKIQFRVRGKKNKSYSGWTYYTKETSTPPVPSGTAELENELKTKFSWSVNTNDTTWAIYTGFIWQTVLAKEFNDGDGSKADWKNISENDKGTGTATSGNISREETGWSEPTYSYTRWVRVRSKGPHGMSNWRYLKHVYSRSKMTSNVTASLQKKSTGGYTVSVDWTQNSNYSYPVDKTTVQYLITEPVATVTEKDGAIITTLSCPASGTSGWTSIHALGSKIGNRGISFPVSTNIGANKAIFTRVNTTHDADSSMVEGDPVLVEGSFTTLSAPTGLQISESDPSTHRYMITANHTTNIDGSFIEVLYRTSSNQNGFQTVGIIPYSSKSITCTLPALAEGEALDIGVRSCIGNYSPVNPSTSGVTYYTVEPIARSDIEWNGGSLPLPPKNVVAAQASSTSIQVTWDWSWPSATSAELSWADHEDAWESTSAPSTFTVNDVHAGKWIISGLAVGMWYVRVRLLQNIGDSITYGTYSDIKPVKLSASPDTPHLMLSDGVVSEYGRFTCYWAYVSNDGTGQLQADVAEAFIDTSGNITYSQPIGNTASSQHLTLDVHALGWHAGETHYLVVRVTSLSGETSAGWSAPVPITIADRVTAQIVQTSLVDVTTTMENDEGETVTITEPTLTTMPLTVRATGAGVGGVTRYIIERNGSYHVDRPDESEFEGFDRETIVLKTMPENESQSAEATCEITEDDLIGVLDDGASYNLIAEVKDSYGQVAQSDPIEFVVHWEHQAVEPTAVVQIDKDFNVAFITPQMPESGYEEGDTCDIYRLSIDLPELIVGNAAFGTTYVDPYPTLGQFGGYRVVYKTKYGDYITADNSFAWADYTADEDEYRLDLFGIVIDFDGDQLILPYDVSVDNSWSKDFIETKYLGGTVRGDWNPGVSKSASLSTNIAVQYNPEDVESVRRLAVYSGACHVRTPEGSSYTANVEVKENREERKINAIAKISLDITKVSSEGTDGMTLEDWLSEDE